MSAEPRPPSPDAVRAFAVAGRHSTFALAATELAISPDAVQRHLAEIERALGVQIFVRDGGGILLTAEGRAYHGRIASGLDDIEAMTARVTVAAPEGLAGRWLAPRLARLPLAHPGIEAAVAISDAALEPDGAWSVAIREGTGPWPGLDAAMLWPEELVVVCSPTRVLAPLTLDRLPTDALLPDAGWAAMFAQAGLAAPVIVAGAADAPVEAAVRGKGFALVAAHAVADELREGALVQAVPDTLRTGGGVFVLRRAGLRPRAVDAVFEFLCREAAAGF